jgi:hypothetical protein
MRNFVLSVLFLSVLGTAFAQGHQGPYSSLGGYGNVLYPGTGHAPVTPPGGINGPNFTGRGPGNGRGFVGPGNVDHPQHRRSTVVLYPVLYSGYGAYDPAYSGDQTPAAADPNAAPSVVINQNFVPQQGNPVVREYAADAPPEQPSGMRLYQNPSHPYADAAQNTASVRRAADDEEPTLYLIAFKDHSIIQALGYWMEGGALHYVSVEHSLNQASLDLIDRDLSQRLNDERGVQFKLPAR